MNDRIIVAMAGDDAVMYRQFVMLAPSLQAVLRAIIDSASKRGGSGGGGLHLSDVTMSAPAPDAHAGAH